MTKSDIPEKNAFRQPILDVLNNKGGSAFHNDIYTAVADRLRISKENREIMSRQKVDPKPVYVVRLRWASYDLMKEGKLTRDDIWTALTKTA